MKKCALPMALGFVLALGAVTTSFAQEAAAPNFRYYGYSGGWYYNYYPYYTPRGYYYSPGSYYYAPHESDSGYAGPSRGN